MIERINLIIKAKNISTKQFAEEIGVQPSGLSHILSGRNNPSLDFVMKVIRRFPEIDINWLMFGKGEMYENIHAPINTSAQIDVESSQTIIKESKLLQENKKNNNTQYNQLDPKEANNNTDEVALNLFSGIDKTTLFQESPVKKQRADNELNYVNGTQSTIKRNSSQKTDELELKESVNYSSTNNGKRIAKIIILYNDRSFVEYIPE